jgi:hypothetical protein
MLKDKFISLAVDSEGKTLPIKTNFTCSDDWYSDEEATCIFAQVDSEGKITGLA